MDASWLIIVALLTWSLTGYYKEAVPNYQGYWVLGLTTALAFFLCIVLHELGHAVVARRLGIPIAGINLFLFGGVAELQGEPESPGKEFWMAIAGPLVSVILAAIFWAAGVALDHYGGSAVLLAMFSFLAWINFTVVVFNLVPAFPLDGGRVFRSILWAVLGSLRRATYWASLAGQGFAWILITLGVVLLFQQSFVSGMWCGLVGLFLNGAAQGSYTQVVARQLLHGEPIRRFMNPRPVVVGPGLNLRAWVEEYVYHYHHKSFPVVLNNSVLGLISTDTLSQYPRAEWDQHTVSECMRRNLDEISIQPETDALLALEQMQRSGSSRLLVLDGGVLIGIVSVKDLLHFLQFQMDNEEAADALPEVNARGHEHETIAGS